MRWFLQKTPNGLYNGMHPQPVSSIDQRGTPLGLFHEVPEEMGLGVVTELDAAL